MGLTDKNNNAIQHAHQPGERPAYSITLEDLGAQVQWTVESNNETVAEGAVPIGNERGYRGRQLQYQLSRGFDQAYQNADRERRELLAAALSATIRADLAPKEDDAR